MGMPLTSLLRLGLVSVGLLFLAKPALAWGEREQGALTALAGVSLVRSLNTPTVHSSMVYAGPVAHPVVVHGTVRVRERHWHRHKHWSPAVTWVAAPPPLLLSYHSPLYSVQPVETVIAPIVVESSPSVPPLGCTDIPVKDEQGRLVEYRRDCSAR
jgi:hypothetical protein